MLLGIPTGIHRRILPPGNLEGILLGFIVEFHLKLLPKIPEGAFIGIIIGVLLRISPGISLTLPPEFPIYIPRIHAVFFHEFL